MAITSTQSEDHVRNVVTGRYITTETAAAFKITTGFKPRYVKVVNLAATGSQVEWFEGMADASGMKRVTAGDMTLITTLGITVADDGFTVGLDTDLNVTDEQISYLAIG
jgi:hypothetical protein